MAEDYRKVLGKTEGLQRGFTSGSCATAASLGALLLLTGEIRPEDKNPEANILLNNSIRLNLPLCQLKLEEGHASCGIIKDSGDDEDITHGALFKAEVRWRSEPGLLIKGGTGIGKVTRPGLPVKTGEWAINPGPRKMIKANLESHIPDGQGLELTLSVPEGEKLARKTWNPRLGIEGGISIIGTSGVIEPRSNAAYKASIILLMKSRKAAGDKELFITPGYVGDGYYKKNYSLEDERIIRFGDHAGFALSQGAAKGFKTVHLAAHIGKMAKIAAGLFDTHCRAGDARLETVAALAGAAGAAPEDIRTLLSMKMAEEAVSFLEERSLEETFDLMAERTKERILAFWRKDHDQLPELVLHILDLEGRLLNRLTMSNQGTTE